MVSSKLFFAALSFAPGKIVGTRSNGFESNFTILIHGKNKGYKGKANGNSFLKGREGAPFTIRYTVNVGPPVLMTVISCDI